MQQRIIDRELGRMPILAEESERTRAREKARECLRAALLPHAARMAESALSRRSQASGPREKRDPLKTPSFLRYPEKLEKGSEVPRNAPCACGSGRKHKKCCGAGQ